MARKLTDKQRRFVEEYLVDLNAAQAAIRAGYSTDTAKEIGCENLSKPHLKAEIDKALAIRSRRTGVTADRVIRELAKVAFCNPLDIIDRKTGKVREDVSDEDGAMIAGVKVRDTEFGKECEVKLADKLKALDMLAKHLGMYEKRKNEDEENETGIVLLPEVGDDE